MERDILLSEETNISMEEKDNVHVLNDSWTLWVHLPHDTDWSIKSYKEIMSFKTVEEAIALTERLPGQMVKNCMLFVMRKGIKPTWEDERNRNGGCFSYKISNKYVSTVWKKLTYTLVGETLSNDKKHIRKINGITISPKKNFCVIKIWLSSCEIQNPEIIRVIEPGIISQGCLFKKHSPEY
jgi:hypothetical protein